MRRWGWFVVVMVSVITITLGWAVSRVGATPQAVVTVNSGGDVVADDGVCTLREAITAANNDTPSGGAVGECAAGNGTDTIVFDSGVLTVTLGIGGAQEDANATGDLDITESLTITGSSGVTVTITASALDRVLDIRPGNGGGVTLAYLTIMGGRSPNGVDSATTNIPGTPGEPGGGIRAQSPLYILYSTIHNNEAGRGGDYLPSSTGVGGAGGDGGGVYATSLLNIQFSTIRDNAAGRGGSAFTNPGRGGHGGGIYGTGGITVFNSRIEANETGRTTKSIISKPCTSNNPGGTGCTGNGGGIYSGFSLTLGTVTITANRTGDGIDGSEVGPYDAATPGADSGYGGGVFAVGTADITAVTITNNRTGDGGDGGDAVLAGIDVSGDGGTTGAGAGLYLVPLPTMNMTGSTIAQNGTGNGGDGGSGFSGGVGGNSGSGGGLIVAGNGSVYISNSALITNTTGLAGLNGNPNPGGTPSVGYGGGLYTVGTIGFINSTISGNSTGGTGAQGGGMYIAGTVSTYGSTVANNAAPGGGGGGVATTTVGTFRPRSTILGDNSAATAPDCSGNLNSDAWNLIENVAGCIITKSTTGNLIGADPQLAPLALNGGTTLNHALLPTSPALDGGFCGGPFTDQRGLPRPVEIPALPNVGDGCDKGAYEEQATTGFPTRTPTPPVTPSATRTPTATGTPGGATPTPTATGSVPPATFTPTPTATGSVPPATFTPTPSATGSVPPATFTPTPTGSVPPATFTPTPSATGSVPTATPTVTETSVPTPTPTTSPSAEPSVYLPMLYRNYAAER